MNSFTVIGHRGARGWAPENTLLGLGTGIRLGADWLEFDVQLADGELWLMHDLTVNRTTNGDGILQGMSGAEIRALDAGDGQKVPTLREALDFVKNRVGINIELKTWDGCGAAVAELLRTYIAEGWPPERLLVSSFHHPELQKFHALLPDVPVGALVCGVPLDWAAVGNELGASVLCVSNEFVDEQLISDAHDRGLKFFVYTVNDVREMQALCALKVDGIFTDYPDRARQISR